MTLRTLTLAALLALSPLSAAQQTVPAGTDARLINAVMQIMPLDRVISSIAAADPKWPIQDRPNALDATQLACVRGSMGTAQYREVVAGRVAAYLRDNPQRAPSDLAMLEGPGGRLFARTIRAGIDAKLSGREVDPSSILKNTQPSEMLGMLTLASDAQYAPLRELIGMGSDAVTGRTTGEKAGQNAGMTMMLPLLFKALETCKVPMSVFDEPKK